MCKLRKPIKLFELGKLYYAMGKDQSIVIIPIKFINAELNYVRVLNTVYDKYGKEIESYETLLYNRRANWSLSMKELETYFDDIINF